MISTLTIFGIKLKDPMMPGRLYLAEDGNLTRNPQKAKQVPQNKLHVALREIQTFSRNIFMTEVVNETHD